jgi:uncharacterized membrane protein
MLKSQGQATEQHCEVISMLQRINFKFLFATVLSFSLINTVEFPKPISNLATWLNISNEAFARSSGGRGGGGSFSRPSHSRPSNSGSDRYRSNPPSRDDSYYRRNPGYGGPNVIVVPGGGGYYGGGYSSGFGIFPMFLVLGLFGLIGLFVLSNLLRASRSYSNDYGFPNTLSSESNELDNDRVTVSKLQVALLAQTKNLQSQLSELTLTVDTNTPEGLLELLQESALVLLRNPENWSHVSASSESVSIDKAEQIFNQLSLRERSKFSAETLVNVGGSVRRKQALIPGLQEDPGAYIVVTLLLGTTDDKPLFKEVRSPETLKEALERVASVSPEYLMKFELLWSPQVEEDSLTYDELLTEYTDMVQIA